MDDDDDGRAVKPENVPTTNEGSAKHGFGIIITIVGSMLIIYLLMTMTDSCGRGFEMKMGRPLRAGRKRRLTRTRLGAYACDGARPSCRVNPLHGLRWLDAARHEHASVPAFEQLAHQVSLLGAVSLRDRCLAAAADERRHATRCYTLARAYTQVPWRPGVMPTWVRTDVVDTVAIAVESYRDGAVGEAIAAQLAAEGAARALDPVIAETLATIAGEEQRHADLAWDVIELCIERGGDAVRLALRAAAAEPVEVPSPGPTGMTKSDARRVAVAVARDAKARVATLA